MYALFAWSPWTLIMSLLKWTGPAHITRLVIAIVINAVKSEPFGAWTYMREERLKGTAPLLAHLYSAASIIHISRVFRTETAPSGRTPCVVFVGSMHAVAPVAYTCCSRGSFQSVTSAAVGKPLTEIAADYSESGSALASTFPKRAIFGIDADMPKDGQSGKDLPRKIFEVIRAFVSVDLSHDCLLSRRLWSEPLQV